MQAKLEIFQLRLLKEILGVSTSAVRTGVFGETGDLPDIWRERQRQLLSARQMLKAPPGSLPGSVARATQSGEGMLGIFRLAKILEEQGEVRDIASFASKKSIKSWVWRHASREWLTKAKASTRVGGTYHDSVALQTRGYLKFDFKGRQILTKLRVDDLDLGAASFRGKSLPLPVCQLCGVEPETREHFVLRCRSLDDVRGRGRMGDDAWPFGP